MTDFEASNGVSVRVNEYGDIYLRGAGAPADDWEFDCNIAGALALREFFQHERDEELGRWRWPERPHYVAYARGADSVRIIDERTGRAQEFDRYGESTWVMEDAANAYFEAHPERKPWQRALVGEVWVLSTADGETDAYTAMPVRGGGMAFEAPEGRYLLDDADIESARRIWPEDAS